MPLSRARFDELWDILQTAPDSDPTRQAILAAERRFLHPLYLHERMSGRLPTRVRFPRPSNDIEEAVQWVAAGMLVRVAAKPILVEYDAPPARRFALNREHRLAARSLAHAWRVAERIVSRHRRTEGPVWPAC